jgi:quercetin dioxygenase-like cupin family protein
MRTSPAFYIAALVAIAACSKAAGDTNVPDTSPTAPAASRADKQDIQWGPAPSVLPPGAQIAVLEGDPGATGTFTLRLKFPNGYKIAPHTHPTVENVTVLAGTFMAGMGTQFDESKLEAHGRDAFVSIPAEHAHFAMARGETVVQVHGLGPFVLNYVNQATATR